MTARTSTLAIGCALALASAITPCGVEARRQHEVRHPYQRVWNAALRMVRVDMRLPVTDRDAEAGYLLFEYLEANRKYPGSIEIIAGDGELRPLTKVVVNVAGMPAYVEQMLLDKLENKLVSEYGPPLDPPKVPEAPKPPSEPGKEPGEPKPETSVTPPAAE